MLIHDSVVLAIGGGGLAQVLNTAKPGLAASTGTAVAVIGTLAAVALSYYVIRGLGGIGQEAKTLLNKLAPLVSERVGMTDVERKEMEDKLGFRIKTEASYGSGIAVERQARLGRALNWVAIGCNIAMFATTVTGMNTLGWLISNILMTSGANLLGFVFFTTLGERNRLLLVGHHEKETEEKDALIKGLEEKNKGMETALEIKKREAVSLTEQNRILQLQLEALVAQLRAAGLSPLSPAADSPLVSPLSGAISAAEAAAGAAGVGLFRRPSRVSAEEASVETVAAVAAPTAGAGHLS